MLLEILYTLHIFTVWDDYRFSFHEIYFYARRLFKSTQKLFSDIQRRDKEKQIISHDQSFLKVSWVSCKSKFSSKRSIPLVSSQDLSVFVGKIFYQVDGDDLRTLEPIYLQLYLYLQKNYDATNQTRRRRREVLYIKKFIVVFDLLAKCGRRKELLSFSFISRLFLRSATWILLILNRGSIFRNIFVQYRLPNI